MNTTKEVREQQEAELFRAQMAEDRAKQKANDNAEQEQRPAVTPEVAEALDDYEKVLRKLEDIEGVSILSAVKFPTKNASFKYAAVGSMLGAVPNMVDALLSACLNEPKMWRTVEIVADLLSDPSKRVLFAFKSLFEKGVDPNFLIENLIKTVSYSELFGDEPQVATITSKMAEELIEICSRKAAEQAVAPETEQSETEQTPTQTEE